MDEKTINTYNEMAKEYDEETIDFWKRFPDTIISKFYKKIKGDKKILDIGSGPGRDGLLLQKKGLNVICLDASLEMVKLCKERGLKSIEANFLTLPFGNNSFDGIWAYTSLLHIPKKDINKALSEIKRVLKKDGIFGLGLIEGNKELYRESSGVSKPRWFAFYTKREIEELLKNKGFDIEYFEEFTPKSKKYLNFISKKLD